MELLQQTGLIPATTYYVVVRNAAAQYLHSLGPAAFEAYNAADWTTYAFLRATPNTAGLWSGDIATLGLPTGSYGIELRASTGTDAIDDSVAATLDGYWDGSSLFEQAYVPWGGAGSYAYTITVTDGSDAIPNVSATLTNSGDFARTALTNVDGVATFNVDADTYEVALVKNGYSFGGDSITIAGAGNTAEAMIQTVIPSTPPAGQMTCWYYTELVSTAINYTMTAVPSGNGLEFVGIRRTVTSDATTRYWEASLFKGARYAIQAGDGAVIYVTIPSDSRTSMPLANLLGGS